MADPRSSFRFRMPRLRPSVPPPRTTTRRPSPQPEPPTTPPIQPQARPPPAPSVLPPPSELATTVPAPAAPPPPSTAPAPVLPRRVASTAATPVPPSATSTTPAPTVLPPAPSTASAPVSSVPPAAPQNEPRSMPPPTEPPSPTVSPLTKPSSTKSPEPTKTDSQPSSPSQPTNRSRVSSQPPPPSRISTEPGLSAKPPLPSTTSQLTSHPSSPTVVQPSPPPSPTVTTPKVQPKESPSPSSRPMPDIASNNDQNDADLALNSTPDAITEVEEKETKTTAKPVEETIMEKPTIEAPKVEEKQQDAINTTSKVPNTPETKSVISQPIDAKSSQNPKTINRSEASTDVNETDANLRTQISNEKPVSVITLAGDNRGTSMRINGATKRERKIHIHRRYKTDPDEIADTTADEEECSNGKKSEPDSKATDDLEKNAYINCNIQGINNSMVFNSSFAERNPGVHLGRNVENMNKLKRKKSKPTDTNLSQTNKTIRRKCLRGYLMESSNSGSDDPLKPRRHGCRYTGGEKSNKEEKIDDVV